MRRLPRPLSTLVIALIVGLTVVACSDPSTEVTADDDGGTAPQSTTTDLPSPSEPGGLIEDVYVDPSDGSQLRVRVSCAVPPAGEGGVLEVAESDQSVTLSLAMEPVAPPCLKALVRVSLEAPLGERTVVDRNSGDQIPVQDDIPMDPARVVPAECSGDAARRVVEFDVDGGLRSDIRTCDSNWMAVATSSNACAPTGEEQDPEGCIANEHVGYWKNRDGAWALVAFDDCDRIRRQYENFGDVNCAG